MFTIKETPCNVVTLAFLDPDLETAFQKDYFEKTIVQVRLALLFAAFLYGMFGILDNFVIPTIRKYTWFIRFFLISPLLLGTFVLTYSKYYRELMRLWLFIAGFASGAGIIVMIVRAPSPGNHLYYSGVLLCVLFYLVFIPDFITATILSWSLFVLYVTMVVFASDIPLSALMNNTSLFIAFNLTGMFACYSSERYIRSDFLQRRTIQERTDELRRALQDVEKARWEAEERSQLDSLTGLPNRRHFLSIAEQEWERNVSHLHSMAIIMLDIDYFKNINDTRGHSVGDLVLNDVADKIRDTIRKSDTPCRYGGDEFAILLPETDFSSALMIGERLKQVIEESIVGTETGAIFFTISAGIATLTEGDITDLDVLIEHSDQALYEAKNAGRNQVKLWNKGRIEDRGIGRKSGLVSFS